MHTESINLDWPHCTES